MKSLNTLLLSSSFIIISACQTPTSQLVYSAKQRADTSQAQATGQKYAISTQGRYSTLAGQKMIQKGGNLIDAAVAASFTVSVERPQSTGIGGGGFMIYHEAKTKKIYAIDFRERAPLKAHKDLYLEKDGGANLDKSQNGILSVGVPGLVAGLIEIHQKFGQLKLSEVLEPAIELADQGFPLYEELHRALSYKKDVLAQDPEAARLFLLNGEPPPLGHMIVQKDLAQTLRQIAKSGKRGFYQGPVAQSILKTSKKYKGLLTQKDLDIYQVKWREPIQGDYAGYKVYSMPPPSSGGIHVIQFLKFLEKDNLIKYGPQSVESIHLAASALQSAFADRATYLGDPDFVKVPQQELVADNYLLQRRKEVVLNKARKAADVKAGTIEGYESSETTHMSLMDSEGNAIATTQTVNGWMGASIVAQGSGVLLNNEMDDFSAKKGTSNLFGAIGGEPNAIAPQKTPLSSMSPTILMKDQTPHLAIGAPGGTRIISCVAQTILNYTEFKLSLYDSVASVRYHHQWQPDYLLLEEPGPAPKVVQGLKNLGYEVKIQPIGCNVMAVAKEGDVLKAMADPRDIGTSVAE